MTVDQIRPSSLSLATNESSLPLRGADIHRARSSAYDAAKSSLVSLSQGQKAEGSFLATVWSVVTWPVRALGSFWAWLTGSNASDDCQVVDGKEANGGPAVDAFLAHFKKRKSGEEFDSEGFRDSFAALSVEQRRRFSQMLWAAGGHQASTGARPSSHEKLLKQKDEYDEGQVRLLGSAAAMFRATETGKLTSLATRFDGLADKMLAALESDEDDASSLGKEEKKLKAELERLPKTVQDRLAQLEQAFSVQTMACVPREYRDEKDAYRAALGLRAKAGALQTLAQGYGCAVADPRGRFDLASMQRRLAEKGCQNDRVMATESEVVAEFHRLGTAAKEVYARALGCAIGRPGLGEEYLLGRLEVAKDEVVAPSPELAAVVLRGLVTFDGGRAPRALASLRFTDEDEDEGGGGGGASHTASRSGGEERRR